MTTPFNANTVSSTTVLATTSAATTVPGSGAYLEAATARVARMRQNVVSQKVTPRYTAREMRPVITRLATHAGGLLGVAASDLRWRQRYSDTRATQLHEQLGIGVTALELAGREFQNLDAAVRGASPVGRFYTPRVMMASQVAAELLVQVRSVVSLRLDGSHLLDAAIRGGCGVGETTRYDSPVEVRQLLDQQLVCLSVPENREYLEARGFLPDVWLEQLSSARDALLTELADPRQLAMSSLRAARDEAHVTLEAAMYELAGLVQLVLGSDAFDEFRSFFPQRRASRNGRKAAQPAGDPREPNDVPSPGPSLPTPFTPVTPYTPRPDALAQPAGSPSATVAATPEASVPVASVGNGTHNGTAVHG